MYISVYRRISYLTHVHEICGRAGTVRTALFVYRMYELSTHSCVYFLCVCFLKIATIIAECVRQRLSTHTPINQSSYSAASRLDNRITTAPLCSATMRTPNLTIRLNTCIPTPFLANHNSVILVQLDYSNTTQHRSAPVTHFNTCNCSSVIVTHTQNTITTVITKLTFFSTGTCTCIYRYLPVHIRRDRYIPDMLQLAVCSWSN